MNYYPEDYRQAWGHYEYEPLGKGWLVAAGAFIALLALLVTLAVVFDGPARPDPANATSSPSALFAPLP